MEEKYKIRKEIFDGKMNGENINIKADAFLYFGESQGYKPQYLFFVEDDYSKNNWKNLLEKRISNPFEHKKLFSDNDILYLYGKYGILELFHTSSLESWSEWFLRKNAPSKCEIKYKDNNFEVGDLNLLNRIGVELI